jgi:THO complex subunit 1
MANEDDAGVHAYKRLVDSLLDRAAQVKPDKQIEPPLTETHLGESIWQVPSEDDKAINHLTPQTKLAAVEIAFREKFYRVLVWPVQTSSPRALLTVRHRPRLLSMILLSFKSGTS